MNTARKKVLEDSIALKMGILNSKPVATPKSSGEASNNFDFAGGVAGHVLIIENVEQLYLQMPPQGARPDAAN